MWRRVKQFYTELLECHSGSEVTVRCQQLLASLTELVIKLCS